MSLKSRQHSKLDRIVDWRIWNSVAQDPRRAQTICFRSRCASIVLSFLCMLNFVVLFCLSCAPETRHLPVQDLVLFSSVIFFFWSCWLAYFTQDTSSEDLARQCAAGPLGLLSLLGLIFFGWVSWSSSPQSLPMSLSAWAHTATSVQISVVVVGVAGPTTFLLLALNWLKWAIEPHEILADAPSALTPLHSSHT